MSNTKTIMLKDILNKSMENDLGVVAGLLNDSEQNNMYLAEEFRFLTRNCTYESEWVGECDCPDNKSCSMTPCNYSDCPLGKNIKIIGFIIEEE